MHLIGKSTNAIEFDISLVHIRALNRDLDEILIYEWKTNADAGSSNLRMFGYFKGGIRRLLDLWGYPGEMSYRMADGELHVSGDMTKSCLVCGKPKSLTLNWNNRLGGFTLLHPADHAYAKYLGYDLPGDGVRFSYSSVVSQYHQASAHLLKMYHKAYDPADQTGREKLRRAEIAWIEEKRSVCGHQQEALEPGNLAIAECLIGKTASRSLELESDTEGAQEVAQAAPADGGGGSSPEGRATQATLDKCRDGFFILTNQLMVTKALATRSGYYVTAITSEPYPPLSSGDVSDSSSGRVVCGYKNTYEFSKNPVAMGMQVLYRDVSYDQFVVRDSNGKVGGVHFVKPKSEKPGAMQYLKDALQSLIH